MQIDKLIGGIERFFFDIVGSLIPGAILLFGLRLLLDPVALFGVKVPSPEAAAEWWLFVAVAYAVGNGLTTVGERVLVPCFLFLTSPVRRLWLKAGKRTNVVSHNALLEEVSEREAFKQFARRIFPAVDRPGVRQVHELRNVAMSMISPDERATVIRFMFLSLLSLGTATAIWLLGAATLIVSWPSVSWRRVAAALVVTFVLSLFFILRRFEFFKRAIQLPFDMAVALTAAGAGQARSAPAAPGRSAPKTVYLAGGHQTAWRQRVMAEVRAFEYRDPSTHGLTDARAYTAWDLEAVRNSDVLFAYFEATNPSGYGLTLEAGYAAALGKHVIFVDEKSATDPAVGRYLNIVKETANVSFNKLEEGIEYLRRLGSLAK